MGKGLKEVVQSILSEEDPLIPQSVSNRLLMATVLGIRDELKEDINGNSGRIEENARRYLELVKSDKKWASIAVVLAAVVSAAAAVFSG